MWLQALNTLVIIALICGLSLVFEKLSKVFKIQRLVFELILGIIVGSTLLVHFIENSFIADFAVLGSIVLLFSVGFGSNFEHLTKKRKEIIILASTGIILPFILVFLTVLALRIPLFPALFISTAAVSTSIGVTARMLLESNICDSDIGVIVLGSSVLDDVYGIIMLTFLVALLKPIGFITFGYILAAIFAFFAIISMLFAFKKWSKDRVHEKYRKRILVPSSASLPLAAKIFGFSPIMGAFFSGLLLSKLDIHERYFKMMRVIYRIFVPIFFVFVGSQLSIAAFFKLNILIVGLLVTFMIFIGQLFAGLSLGGIIGFRKSLAVGLGMLSRGEVALIIATTGVEAGIITKEIFSSIIIMVFLTTLIQPFIFTRLVKFCREKIAVLT
jgi:Kef-type K+ transport system membrane component KefB